MVRIVAPYGQTRRMLGSALNQSGLEGKNCQLCTVAQVELGKDVAHVALDGALCEVESGTDLTVGEPSCD